MTYERHHNTTREGRMGTTTAAAIAITARAGRAACYIVIGLSVALARLVTKDS
jgi:hypothetical protein